MLCRRSASLMMTTRTSVTMASSILRMFSAWWSSRFANLILVQLGDAFDDVRNLLVEPPGDLGAGDVGVFDCVVQQAGGDGGRIHLEVGEDLADLQRMDDVGLARGAALSLMLLDAEGPGAADEVEVVVGTIVVHGLQQMLEAHVDFGGRGKRSGTGQRLGRGRWSGQHAGGFGKAAHGFGVRVGVVHELAGLVQLGGRNLQGRTRGRCR